MKEAASASTVIGQALRVELIAVLAVSLLALGHGVETAYSTLLGGSTSILPNAYFARRVFGQPVGGTPIEVAGLLYRAEVTKLALAVLMFAAVFAFVESLNVLALLLGFVVARAAGVVASVRES